MKDKQSAPLVYLDNAATTFPKPARVYDEINRCMTEYCGNPGRSSHPLAAAADEAVFDARVEAAGLFGVSDPSNVIFTHNATDAINKTLRGVMRGGERLVMSNIEHNSVYRAVTNLCSRLHSSFDFFNAGGTDDELIYDLETKLRSGADIVICLHASNICSRVLPIERIGELCRRYGALFILDASQSAGTYDIDMRRNGVSVLCAPGHKGLYGPQGTGLCVFCDGFDFDRLSPCVFGGNGTRSADVEMGREPPESYEAGTVNVPGIAGLGEGIRFVKRLGGRRILMHERRLFARARTQLQRLGAEIYLPECEGGVMLFNFADITASALSEKLGESNVCTRAGLHCAPLAHKTFSTGGDAVRISFSAFNTDDDIDRFIEVLRAAI